MKTIEYVIFDLDGTLWDSCVPVAGAWTQAVCELGFPDLSLSPAQVKTTMGLSFDEIFAKLWPHLSIDEQRRIGLHCEDVEAKWLAAHPGILYPGVAEGIRNLAQSKTLAIVSNCQKGYIENFLKHSALGDCFAAIECFGNTQKPKEENILSVKKILCCEEALYVGDTLKDEKAARAARCHFAHAAWGFGQVESPDWVFDSFEALVNGLLAP
jgi:phosphoglycolate phosphatase